MVEQLILRIFIQQSKIGNTLHYYGGVLNPYDAIAELFPLNAFNLFMREIIDQPTEISIHSCIIVYFNRTLLTDIRFYKRIFSA